MPSLGMEVVKRREMQSIGRAGSCTIEREEVTARKGWLNGVMLDLKKGNHNHDVRKEKFKLVNYLSKPPGTGGGIET